jgi:ABC-2 type transport system ATP-binding protein
MDFLKLESVYKSFENKAVLNGITMELKEGEIFGILGADGSGKSTILKIIAGFIPADKGNIQIEGEINFVQENFSLYNDLTVYENIKFFVDLYGKGKDKIEEFLDIFKLSKFKERLAADLSGGMKQKLYIACTMIVEPKILILDEPTRGVDPRLRHEIWDLFRNYVSNGDKSIILATSNISESKYCNRVGLLYKGEFKRIGSPIEMINNFDKTLIEVDTKSLIESYKSLEDKVLFAQPFGNRLHILLNHIDEMKNINEMIDGEWREIEPTIEDIFLYEIKNE